MDADLKGLGNITTPIYRIRLMGIPSEEMGDEKRGFRLYRARSGSYYVTKRSLRNLRMANASFQVVAEIPPQRVGISIVFPLEAILQEMPNDEAKAEMLAFALSRKDEGRRYRPIYVGRTNEDVPGTFVLDMPGGTRNYRWRWDDRMRGRKQPTFRQRFPKLISRMTDPHTRFVVSLGGGGMLLFAHPSIFQLIEAMGAQQYIDEIWGCSGGAIAGLAYSLGATKRIFEQEGYDIYNRKYNFQLSPTKLEVIKNLLLANILPGGRISLKGFVDIQTSLQDSLARICRHHRPRIPFYALAYNMNTNRNEALTSLPVPKNLYGDFMRHTSPINAVLASAAIPVLFVPMVIKRGTRSDLYIDGSLFEEVPLISVYRKWRIDRQKQLTKHKKLFILSVNLFPYFSTQKFFGDIFFRYLPFLELSTIMLRLLDLSRRARIDGDMRLIRADHDATVTEVRLPRMSKHNFLDPQVIPIAIDKARVTFFEQLKEIEEGLDYAAS